MRALRFMVYGRPEPQGSAKAFVVGGRARITSDNAKLKPFRQQVTQTAIAAVGAEGVPMPMFAKHVPVRCDVVFRFRRPASIPKRRTQCVVKPDLDKLLRAAGDALTGVVWHDDSQVVETRARKEYGEIEGMDVVVTEVAG